MQKKIKLVMMACMVTSMHSVESLNANEGQTQETPKGPDVHYQSVDWRTLVGANDFSIEELIDFGQKIPTGKDGRFKSEIDKIWDEIKKIQQKDPHPTHWTQHPVLKKKIESIPVGLKTSFEGRMYVVSVNGFDVYVPVLVANQKVGMVRALIPMMNHTIGVKNNIYVQDNSHNKVIQAINIEHPRATIHGLPRDCGVHLDNVQGDFYLDGPVGGHVFLTHSNELELGVSRKYLLSMLKSYNAFYVFGR